MAITLFRHNQEAYRAVRTLLEKENRAAVVHPTGTGKSMVAFYLIQQQTQWRFLWLSPSEYIVRTQLENVQKADPEADFSHVQFMTYARLMLLPDKTLAELQPDCIILDEFHRCGAEMWGEGVQRLLEMYPQAKQIGLSATKIRYLDHQRDMVEELFDNHIASEMTLGEAVVRGILPAPRYVTTIYQYQQGLERYQQRINKMRSRRQRDRSEQYLQALRRAMENADGLDKVFQRHLTDKNGRYLVFCSGVNHMKEMHARTKEWFGAVDEEPHCYFVYADSAESSEAYNAFRNDESNHLKLLFCVNMLNEGVHVEGVSGVILFRPTVSPIIYKQQIGRALTAGTTAEPLILDVVNNAENLYSIGSIQQEMEDAVMRLRGEGQDDLIVRENFTVLDQVKDCRELFEQLEESLFIDWEEYYQAATQYWQEHHHLQIPQRYVTADGKCLGGWLFRQRRIYTGSIPGKLTEAQVQRLEDIGIVWESLKDAAWDEHFDAAKRYFDEHGDLDIPSAYLDENGFALGKWIIQMRMKYQRLDELTDREKEQLTRLESIGMIWNCFGSRWNTYLECARRYYAAHGNLMVPADYKTTDGIALGRWIFAMRAARRGTAPARKLTPEQITQLDSVGMYWGDIKEERWRQMYSAAHEYYQVHGDLSVRKNYVTEDGLSLGVWLMNQRARRKKTEGTEQAMPVERVELLDAIGMKW